MSGTTTFVIEPAPAGERVIPLFWEMIMPDERLGFQAYLYLSGNGKAGFNVAVWGPDPSGQALDLVQAEVPVGMDLDAFSLEGHHAEQPELRRTARI